MTLRITCPCCGQFLEVDAPPGQHGSPAVFDAMTTVFEQHVAADPARHRRLIQPIETDTAVRADLLMACMHTETLLDGDTAVAQDVCLLPDTDDHEHELTRLLLVEDAR